MSGQTDSITLVLSMLSHSPARAESWSTLSLEDFSLGAQELRMSEELGAILREAFMERMERLQTKWN